MIKKKITNGIPNKEFRELADQASQVSTESKKSLGSSAEKRLSSELVSFKTKLLLVNPPSSPEGKRRSNKEDLYPYSLLFLISYLYKHGYERGRILDLSVAKNPQKELVEYIRDNQFDVIGFTSITENRFFVWDLIELTRKINPKAKILAGGDHFTYTAEVTLKTIPEIDIVVRGEGELTLFELMKIFEKEGEIEDIFGISYRKGKRIIANPDRPVERDIDKLKINEEAMQFAMIPDGKYSPFRIMRNYEYEQLKALYIHAGRGCPGRCVFCLYNKMRYRTRTVESVLTEIKQKIKKYKCNMFYLHDPFLLKNKKFVIELCNRILEEGLDVKWYAESRLDIDTNLIPIMSKAGCISMDFGLESFSPKVLAAIKKDVDISQAQKIVDICRKHRIRIKLFTMLSLPEETEEDALNTLYFLKRNRKFIAKYSGAITRIYPGSELENMAKAKNIIDKDFDWYDRKYKNPLSHLLNIKYSRTPIWLENLRPEFIKRLLLEYRNLRKKKMSEYSSFRSKLLLFCTSR